MNSRALRWYVVFSIVVLIALTVFFVYRLQEVREGNKDNAAVHFLTISQMVSESTARSFDGELRTFSPLQVLTVFTYNDGVEYLWTRSPEYVGTYSLDSEAVPSIQYDELTQTQFSRSFTDGDGTSHVITAVYTILDGQSLYPVLRDTLIAILVFVLFAVVVAVFQTAEASRDIKAPVLPVDTTAMTEDEPPLPEPPPDSGLSEAHLLDRRLSLELERSAFNEQDFSAALLEFPGVLQTDEMYRSIAASVLELYSFEDLCFEYGDGQIVVLFPNAGLKETLSTIERYQRHFWQQRSGWEDDSVELYAGISSRNGRLVDAPRLLHEIETALHHSHDVAGHIMGFEPDPQKYREFILSEKDC